MEKSETEKPAKKHKYDDYGAPVSEYDEYYLTEEDEILRSVFKSIIALISIIIQSDRCSFWKSAYQRATSKHRLENLAQ